MLSSRKGSLPIEPVVRRFAAIVALRSDSSPPPPRRPTPPWAQPQIKAVVEAGLLADSVAGFKPQRPLTQKALASALETLSLAQPRTTEIAVPAYRYRVVVPGRAVTIRELDAALVGFLGLGDSARSVTAALRDAGLDAEGRRGHRDDRAPARLPLQPSRVPTTRSSSASTTRRRAPRPRTRSPACSTSPAGSRTGSGSQTETLALPELLRRPAAGADAEPSRSSASRTSGAARPRRRSSRSASRTPGGFDCSGFVWRVFKLEPFPGASALASVLRGRTTYADVGRGAAGAADPQGSRTSSPAT